MIDLSDPKLTKLLEALARTYCPNEAVGVLYQSPSGEVILRSLKNTADNPLEGFSILPGDILNAMGKNWWLEATKSMMDEVYLWHSHPKGNIGPSRTDLQNKIKGLRFLVITLTEPKGAIITEY